MKMMLKLAVVVGFGCMQASAVQAKASEQYDRVVHVHAPSVTLGEVALRTGYALVGVVALNAAAGLAGTSLLSGAYAAGSTVGLLLSPFSIIPVVGFGAISFGSGCGALICGSWSWSFFKAAIANNPVVVVVDQREDD